MLTDEAQIKIKAGDGGNGIVSFRHEKYVPKGGPDGGDGGKGADVYFVCDNNLHTLTDYARKKEWQGQNGEHGKPKRQTGKGGDDLFLRVPPGTIIKVGDSLVYDFKKAEEKIIIVRGGRGGWGNVHFATATRQSPVIRKYGEPGEEKTLKLELKMLADVGLVGLPNSGKSTLLSRISNARPKIADYPFTTLEPNLGVARYHDKEIVVADIPGLIEGASEGRGLGIKFLRHLERTSMLVHLIDINSSDVARDYRTIREELKNWNPLLWQKEEIIVLNKADTIEKKEAQQIAAKLSQDITKPVLIISAVSGKGVEELLKEMAGA